MRNALRGVIDPELGDNIVELEMVRSVHIDQDGQVVVEVALTVAGCPLRAQLRDDVTARVKAVPGVSGVKVRMGEMNPEERGALMARARWKAREGAPANEIPARTRVVAIASGKGGVGKSSVTANLAAAMAGRGLTVGVLDADIWGFSLPRMLGLEGRISGERTDAGHQQSLFTIAQFQLPPLSSALAGPYCATRQEHFASRIGREGRTV